MTRSRHIPSRPHRAAPAVNPLATLEALKDRVSLLTPKQRSAYLEPIQLALARLREGGGTLDHLLQFSDAMSIAAQLCKRGMASDREAEIGGALSALADILTRMKADRRIAPLQSEIRALEEGYFFHVVQINHCTNQELDESAMAVVRRTRQALRGHHAAGALVIDPLAQEANVNEAAALHAAST